MKAVKTAPIQLAADAERGEVVLPINGENFLIRFGLKFLKTFTRQVGGEGPTDALQALATAPLDALVDMVALAIRLSVPADKLPENFDADVCTDLLDGLPATQQKEVFTVLLNAVQRNPFIAVLTQVTTA